MPPSSVPFAVATVYLPVVKNLGPFGFGAFLFVVVGGYLVGAPPMVLAGLLTAKAAREGRDRSRLIGYSIWVGFVAGSFAALIWRLTGWIKLKLLIALAMALAGAICSAAICVFLISNAFFTGIALRGHLPAPLGAWASPLFFSALGVTWLRYLK